MKRNFIVCAFACMLLAGCGSEVVDEPKMAEFVITFNLNEGVGESMTRGAAAEGWAKFYEQIKDGSMAAEDYEITFSNADTGHSYTFNGKWASRDVLTMPAGKYKVTGSSVAAGDRIQQRCSLSFDTEIEVDQNTTSVSMSALYDCFLLAFFADGITSITNHYWDAHHTNGYASDELYKTADGEYIYCFVNDQLCSPYQTTDYNYMSGIFENGSSFRIETYASRFEKGKYYIYQTIPSAFSLPEMESGM